MEQFDFGENPDVTTENSNTLDKLHKRARKAQRANDEPKIHEKDVFVIPKGHALLKKAKSKRRKS